MKNTIRVNAPLKQEIEITCRYDKEWETYFLSIFCIEVHPEDNRRVGEETTICINNRKELDKLIGLLQKVTEKVK